MKQPSESSGGRADCLSYALDLARAACFKLADGSGRERQKREKDLPRNLSFAGRAKELQDLRLLLQQNYLKEWAAIYERVAREQSCPAVLAQVQIENLRQQMMANIRVAETALVDRIVQDAAAAADANPLVVEAWKTRIQRSFQPTLLDVINSELGVLEALGRALLSQANQLGDLIPESAASSQSSESSRPQHHGVARKAASGTATRNRVDAFLDACNEISTKRIRRKHIWLAAGYKEAREFEYFQKEDRKATDTARRNFERILHYEPRKFIGILNEKGLLA
jgi:hypothetical protein